MKISIITPSYNQGAFIEKNILAVMDQNYPDFEHIIIDGGSTDNTVEVLKKYQHLKWISEKDKGQADALNKGFDLVTGEIVGWINADDFYEKNIFKNIETYFKKNKINWLVGTLNEVNLANNKIKKIESPEITYTALIKNPDIVKQPCTFFKTSFIKKAGGWNEKFYMVMDFDLWIRSAKIEAPKMVKDHFANFVIHKDQKTNIKNIKKQLKEITEILKREKAPKLDVAKLIFKKNKSLFKKRIKKIIKPAKE